MGAEGPRPGTPSSWPRVQTPAGPQGMLAPRSQGLLAGVRLLTTQNGDVWPVSSDKQRLHLFWEPCFFSSVEPAGSCALASASGLPRQDRKPPVGVFILTGARGKGSRLPEREDLGGGGSSAHLGDVG